jgi:Periviscerokinin family
VRHGLAASVHQLPEITPSGLIAFPRPAVAATKSGQSNILKPGMRQNSEITGLGSRRAGEKSVAGLSQVQEDRDKTGHAESSANQSTSLIDIRESRWRSSTRERGCR